MMESIALGEEKLESRLLGEVDLRPGLLCRLRPGPMYVREDTWAWIPQSEGEEVLGPREEGWG